MKLVLDRSKWICGQPWDNTQKENCAGQGDTELLNDYGYMCCLGQFTPQLNPAITDEELEGSIYPSGLNKKVKLLNYVKSLGYWVDTKFAKAAMSINDNADTTLSEKEEALVKLCKTNGVELEIVGDYPGRTQ